MLSRDAFLIAALVGAASFAAALAFEHIGGLHPCQLCISQRWALGVGIGGALLAYLTKGSARVFVGLAAVIGFVAEAGLAIYHSGVERLWWEGPQTCSGGGSLPTSFDPGAMVAEASERAPAACNEIPWDLFGLSMANYNVVLAAGMAWLCIKGLQARGAKAESAI